MAEKTKRINIRVTPEEYDLIRKKMQAADMRNMSLYMLKMALRGYVINLAWPNLKEVLRLQSIISNNLNQYARKANTTGSIYREDIEELKKLTTEEIGILGKILDGISGLYEKIT